MTHEELEALKKRWPASTMAIPSSCEGRLRKAILDIITLIAELEEVKEEIAAYRAEVGRKIQRLEEELCGAQNEARHLRRIQLDDQEGRCGRSDA